MPQFNINQKLDELLATKFETEVIEFKEAKNDFSFEELGKYFSALSNEANLHNAVMWSVHGLFLVLKIKSIKLLEQIIAWMINL